MDSSYAHLLPVGRCRYVERLWQDVDRRQALATARDREQMINDKQK